MAKHWMQNPYWNLDLAISQSSDTTTAAAAEAVTTAVSPTREIPLSTIVYRTVEKAAKSQSGSSVDFNLIIFRIRYEMQKFLHNIKMPRIDLAFITAPAMKLVWVTSVLIATYIIVEISLAVYKSYMASRVRGSPKGPVIPIDPTEPIGVPRPSLPNDPPAANPPPKPNPSSRDFRVKFFTEILTGYLVLVLSVSCLLGDSIILKFLLSGLTGFVGMVSLVLPDEAEWSAELYNFREGGFEMQDMVVERGLDERIKEPGMKEKAETKLKEVRDKVAERIQEASTTTKKIKEQVKEHTRELLSSEKKDKIIVVRGAEELEEGEEGIEEFDKANDDLKSQLSKVMAPVSNVLDTDRTIERASKKVEEWLLKAGDSFGADGDEPVEEEVPAAGPSARARASNPNRRSIIRDGALILRD
ncbi:hypothetical protein AA313_de0201052 [Arthrobotrys entomopaga]|nr:hypothetical protein AA313_de0201052 [Arthrobotrys entomopaga]